MDQKNTRLSLLNLELSLDTEKEINLGRFKDLLSN